MLVILRNTFIRQKDSGQAGLLVSGNAVGTYLKLFGETKDEKVISHSCHSLF